MSRPDTQYRITNRRSQVIFLQRSDGTQFPVGREPVTVPEISAHISAAANRGLIELVPITVTPTVAPVEPPPSSPQTVAPSSDATSPKEPVAEETNTKTRKNRSDQ